MLRISCSFKSCPTPKRATWSRSWLRLKHRQARNLKPRLLRCQNQSKALISAACPTPKCNASTLTDLIQRAPSKATATTYVACAATTASASREVASAANATQTAAHSLHSTTAIPTIRATTPATRGDLARTARLAIKQGATHYPGAQLPCQQMVAVPSSTCTTMHLGCRECSKSRKSPMRTRPTTSACSRLHLG